MAAADVGKPAINLKSQPVMADYTLGWICALPIELEALEVVKAGMDISAVMERAPDHTSAVALKVLKEPNKKLHGVLETRASEVALSAASSVNSWNKRSDPVPINWCNWMPGRGKSVVLGLMECEIEYSLHRQKSCISRLLKLHSVCNILRPCQQPKQELPLNSHPARRLPRRSSREALNWRYCGSDPEDENIQEKSATQTDHSEPEKRVLYHGDGQVNNGKHGESPSLPDNRDHEEREDLTPMSDPSRSVAIMNRQAWELPALTCTSIISTVVIMGWNFSNSNVNDDVLARWISEGVASFPLGSWIPHSISQPSDIEFVTACAVYFFSTVRYSQQASEEMNQGQIMAGALLVGVGLGLCLDFDLQGIMLAVLSWMTIVAQLSSTWYHMLSCPRCEDDNESGAGLLD